MSNAAPRGACRGDDAHLLLRREALAASDLGHAFDPPRGLHDPLEMGEVLDLDDRRPGDPAVRGVAAPYCECSCRWRSRPRPRRRRGRGGRSPRAEANREPLTLHFLPVDLETAFRLVRQKQEVGTVAPVDADTAAARHVADHRVARHRLATLRVPDHEPVGALNAHALRAPHSVDQPLDGWLGGRPARGRGAKP